MEWFIRRHKTKSREPVRAWCCGLANRQTRVVELNPFTAQPIKCFGLKAAEMRLQTVHFPVLWHIYFQCYVYLWRSFHMPVQKNETKRFKGLKFRAFMVVYGWHEGSEGVNNEYGPLCIFLTLRKTLFPLKVLPVCKWRHHTACLHTALNTTPSKWHCTKYYHPKSISEGLTRVRRKTEINK